MTNRNRDGLKLAPGSFATALSGMMVLVVLMVLVQFSATSSRSRAVRAELHVQ
ncbi:hypothetical protein [Cohnella sp. AR92]|uniref:hypothetical protein n=1 Tax=Cohnella sp. AR92 TaxID=648716 RepID=UPI001315A0E6|nr:hypothetical protein [Cohnella sp. AR92]